MDIISYKKAQEAKELAQQIVDGEVDTGVLRTNIDQKLNDLEEEYAPKLTQVSSQLADKANEVDVRKRTDLQPINVSEMDTETKQLFTGGAVAVVGENAIGTENVKPKAITPDKVTFMDKTRNLFNGIYQKLELIQASVSGVPTIRYRNYLGEFKTAIIPIEANKTYTITLHEPTKANRFRVGITNSYPVLDKTSYTNTDTLVVNNDIIKIYTFTNTPDGKYLLINVSDGLEPLLQVEEGVSATEYVSHYKLDGIGENSIGEREIKESSIPASKLNFLTTSKNLFNGKYEKGILSYSSPPASIKYRSVIPLDPSSGRVAIIPIESNKTYSIKVHELEKANRFLIAVVNTPVTLTPSFKEADKIINIDNSLKEFTFTNDGLGKSLLVFVSNVGLEPLLQVEEAATPTHYKNHLLVPKESLEISDVNEQFVNELDDMIESLSSTKREFDRYSGNTSPYNSEMLTSLERVSKGGVVGTNGKGAVSFRFDHIRDFGLKVFPLFQARGLVASVTHNTDMALQTTGDETWDSIRTYVENGIEIWSHSSSHLDPTGKGYEHLIYELVESKEKIESEEIKCMGWAMPGTTPTTDETPYGGDGLTKFEDFYETDAGRIVTRTYGISETDAGSIYRPLVPGLYHGLNHITIDKLNVSQVKREIDLAIDYGLGIEFMQHPWVLDNEGILTTAQFAEILDYVVEKRDEGLLEVLTPSSLVFADKRTDHRLSLITNGDFKESKWWTIPSGHTIEASGGFDSPNFLRASTNVFTSQTFIGVNRLEVQGEIFMFEAMIRGEGSARVIVEDTQDASRLSVEKTFSATPEWQKIRVPFSLHRKMRNFRLRLGKTGTGIIDISDVKVMKV